MIWFTADTHFSHDSIIKLCNRPFKNVTEMNLYMIMKWNDLVKNGDIVYHLGDFAWYDSEEILDKLNGQIVLIRGSHDHHGIEKHKKIVKMQRVLNKTIDGQHVTMSHFCFRVWHLSHYNSWHLYGHSHGMLDPIGKSRDVGVDATTDYSPISWDQIKEYMKHRPDNFNLKKTNEKE